VAVPASGLLFSYFFVAETVPHGLMTDVVQDVILSGLFLSFFSAAMATTAADVAAAAKNFRWGSNPAPQHT